jgi:acid phosphatase
MAATALAAAAPALAEAAPLAFLAVGDWGRDGARSQASVADAMAQAAGETNSQFILSVGDNFYPGGVTSARDPQWRTSFEDVYSAASLQTPWYAALGNHDYRGEPEAQLDYARLAGRWRMPARHYVVDAASSSDLEVFVLDTTPLVADYGETLVRLCLGHVTRPNPEQQLRWFASQLANSRATWKVVVGHHPIHSGGRHGGEPALVRSIEPLLQAYGVQAYIFGHDHALQHIQVDGTHHICSGAGSSAGAAVNILGTRFCASTPGFALFRLGGAGLELEFRDAGGRTLHQAPLAS